MKFKLVCCFSYSLCTSVTMEPTAQPVDNYYKNRWIKMKDTISKFGSFQSRTRNSSFSREEKASELAPKNKLPLLESKFYSSPNEPPVVKSSRDLSKLLRVHAYHTKPGLQDLSLRKKSIFPQLSSSSLAIPERAQNSDTRPANKKLSRRKTSYIDMGTSSHTTSNSARSSQPLSEQVSPFYLNWLTGILWKMSARLANMIIFVGQVEIEKVSEGNDQSYDGFQAAMEVPYGKVRNEFLNYQYIQSELNFYAHK